jgi:hypothetical protein
MHTVEFARTWFLPLGLLVVTACSSNGTSALWRIDDVEFGEGYASGGILLHAGEDTDRDGVLSDSEITSTTPVCDGVASASGETGPAGQDGDTGETGATGETGDADCLTGGLSIQVGLENGDGGATGSFTLTRSTTLQHRPGELRRCACGWRRRRRYLLAGRRIRTVRGLLRSDDRRWRLDPGAKDRV